mgnify:FL=1
MISKEDIIPHNRSARVHDYDSALKLINAMGDTNESAHLGDYGLTVRIEKDGTIAVTSSWNGATKYVSYLKNGIVRLEDMTEWGVIRASTRRILSRYANLIAIDYKKGKYYLRRPSDKLSPIRGRRCDVCKGAKRLYYSCEGEERYRVVMTQFGKQYINTKCSVEGPNKTQTHRDSVLCEKCSGEGKIPWGGQPVSMEWDKKPLYLDIKTGLILDEGSVNS